MGRWGWEGNKAGSCEYLHPSLSLFREAYKKFLIFSFAKATNQPLLKAHLVYETFTLLSNITHVLLISWLLNVS